MTTAASAGIAHKACAMPGPTQRIERRMDSDYDYRSGCVAAVLSTAAIIRRWGSAGSSIIMVAA